MNFWKTNELMPGMTLKEVSRRTGRSIESARAALKRHGIPFIPETNGYPQEVRERARRLRRQGVKCYVIAGMLGCSKESVSNWTKDGA